MLNVFQPFYLKRLENKKLTMSLVNFDEGHCLKELSLSDVEGLRERV